MLLEIFAKYASDSIEKFRLYERLERKMEALKKANETILLSRENMIQAERLAVLAEMAGEVAHEIRNPLTVIGGFAKSMIKKMTPGQPNYEYLKIMYEQVARIERAIEKFTSLTNYKSKDDRPCELVELLRSALVVSAAAGARRFYVTSGERILVKLDPDLIRQALIIILRRAHAILDGEGTIGLTTSRAGEKAFIFFEATDGSGGFAEELHRSLHASGDRKNVREAATSLEIIKYYGGDLGLKSCAEGGSRFYVELPVYEEGK
jgi:signal transduction histidine kinase